MTKAGNPVGSAGKVVPLRRDSPIAMHRQLELQLREAIQAGVYAAGARLPTEPELMKRYGVSRITARQAVTKLAQEGLVVRKQGKGTFVTSGIVHHDLAELRGVYDELVAQGVNPTTEIIEFSEVAPPPHIAQRLRSGARRLVRWQRLYRAQGEPFAVGWVHLAPTACKVTRELASRHASYHIFEKILHVPVDRAEFTIRSEKVSPAVRMLLKMRAGDPVITFERVTYTVGDRPIEHSLYYARAENYEFFFVVKGKLSIANSLREAL